MHPKTTREAYPRRPTGRDPSATATNTARLCTLDSVLSILWYTMGVRSGRPCDRLAANSGGKGAMAEARDRRAVPRTTLTDHPAVRVQEGGEVRLLDLSRDGARIEHLDLLRPGASCRLELPGLASLSLPAQVLWCTVIGRMRRPDGNSHLVSQSGLRFSRLTVAQHAALAWLLSESRPPDDRKGSA